MNNIPIGRCALGSSCMNPTHQLRNEHRCFECTQILHSLCGVFDISKDKYKCSIDCRKVDAIVHREINTLSSDVSLSLPPIFHQSSLCLPTNTNSISNTTTSTTSINTTKLVSTQSQSLINITSSKLRESIITNSSWRGSIDIHTQHWFVNSLHQTVIKDDLLNSVELKTDNTVNLLDCISKSNNHLHIKSVLQHNLGYPPNAAVCFEQYVGDDPDTTKSLINYIKGQALNSGIQLISQSQNMKKVQASPTKMLDLVANIAKH